MTFLKENCVLPMDVILLQMGRHVTSAFTKDENLRSICSGSSLCHEACVSFFAPPGMPLLVSMRTLSHVLQRYYEVTLPINVLLDDLYSEKYVWIACQPVLYRSIVGPTK